VPRVEHNNEPSYSRKNRTIVMTDTKHPPLIAVASPYLLPRSLTPSAIPQRAYHMHLSADSLVAVLLRNIHAATRSAGEDIGRCTSAVVRDEELDCFMIISATPLTHSYLRKYGGLRWQLARVFSKKKTLALWRGRNVQTSLAMFCCCTAWGWQPGPA
jgi:hypothetical protein